MRVVCVWRDNTDYVRTVIDWKRDFDIRTSRVIEELDPDTPEGISFCQAYDVMEYPSFVALDDNGHVLQMWRGLPLPRFDEIAYYASDEEQTSEEIIPQDDPEIEKRFAPTKGVLPRDDSVL